MATRLNYSKTRQHDRIRDRGSEDVAGGFPAALGLPRLRKSKAAQRAEIEAGINAVTRKITCSCGHTASVVLPTAKRSRRLRCSQCGTIAEVAQ